MVILEGNPLINPSIGLVFWTTLTFLILLFLLRKFAWKPILSAVKSREDSIESALAAAEIAKAEKANLTAESERIAKEAREQRDALLKDAQETANAIISEAKTKAGAEAQIAIEKAQAAIESERRAAVADIKNQAAVLSVDIAEKLLQRELRDKKAQEELLDQYIKEIELA